MVRILFVDSDPEILNAGRQFFELHPETVVDTVESPRIALSLLNENPYDAIISEYFTPDIGGDTFLRRVRLFTPYIPFIFFTAHEDELTEIEALHNGADFYLKKSPDYRSQFSELAQVIKIIISRLTSEELLRRSEEKFPSLEECTSRKNAETLLIHERDNFLKIFRAAPVGLLLLNKDTEITQANDIISAMVFREPADIIRKRGGGGLGCVHSLEDPRGCGYSSSCPDCPLRHGIEAVIREGISIHGAVIPLALVINDRPHLRWLNINAEPVEIEGANYVIVAVDDITEQREMENALRKSEKHYRSLFDNMLEGFAFCRMLYDANGLPSDWIYIDVNNAFERLTGISDAKGRLVSDLIPTIRDQTPELFERYNRVVVTGVPETFEIDFTPLHVWFRISVYRPEDGHFVSVFENITERKMAESHLQKLISDHQTILENVPAMIWYKDTKNTFVKVNPAAAQIFGRPIHEIEGKTYPELFPYDEDLYYQDDLEVIEEKRPKIGIVEVLTTAHGGKIWVQTDKVPLYNNKSEVIGVLVVSTDITERIMSKDAISLANKKLNLLSGITRHDIGNQLQVIFGYLGFAREGDLDPQMKGFIDKSYQSARQIERQIAFTRDYQDIGVNSPVWQDVRTVITHAVQTIDISPIQIYVEISGVEIFSDPLMEKVFFNLIDNSKRYGEKITEIRFFGYEEQGGYIIICADDGVGIPNQYKSAIFKREYYHHTGFGLNLSREILEITNISILEVGQQGKGARFEIRIPKGGYRYIKDPHT